MTKKDFTITLHFGDQETVDYIQKVCRRKDTCLESHILDNFEWDEMPVCIRGNEKNKPITWEICEGCEYDDRCPDFKPKKVIKQKVL